jgi:hypothetical protein
MIDPSTWFSWNAAKEFFNSAFTTSLVGALAGAYAGARAAQAIAERAKEQEQMLGHLSATNAAIMISFSICNSALALKKQHVQQFYDQFVAAKRDLLVFQAARAANQGQPEVEYRFVADLRSFPAPVVPMEMLRDLAFHKVATYGRPLATVSVLEQSIVGLAGAITKRDALVHDFKTGVFPDNVIHKYYFGLPLPGGDTNQEYPDVVEAIHSYVDDVAFFSALLCADLVEHGNRIRDRLRKRSKKLAVKVSTPDFSAARNAGLLPPDDQYRDWMRAFAEQEPNSQSQAGAR